MCKPKAHRIFLALFVPLIFLAVGILVLAIVPDAAASPEEPGAPEAPQVGPLLSIQSNISATANSIVTVPVRFTANGNSISSLIFSIDYDQTWLWFDPSVPMSVTMSLPAGFVGGCTPNTGDPFAEINCYVLYPIPPLQPLTDGVIASIKLRTKAPTVNLSANVGFSVTNPASFGSTSGTSVAGSTQDGSVYIDVGCPGCGNKPQLWIQSSIPAAANSIVSVPVNFSANGTSIYSLTFSIDYDQTWLWFDASVPNAVTPSLPSGFSGNCTSNIIDPLAELDCWVTYSGTPKQALSDGVIFTIKLRTEAPASNTLAAVNFSGSKLPRFTNTSGVNVTGNTQNGSVYIQVVVLTTKIFLPIAMKPIPVEPPCQNYAVQNSAFNPSQGWWNFPATVYTAGYSNYRFYSPSYSARTGIDPYIMPGFNLFSYSSVRSPAFTLPYNASSIRLRFWQFPIATGMYAQSADRPLPEKPALGEPLVLGPDAGDLQYVLVLDPWDNILSYKQWTLSNAQRWVYSGDLGLLQFAGQTIKLQFGTFNDGWGGVAAMYVDDVNLEVCTP